jgi:hypothetical protein
MGLGSTEQLPYQTAATLQSNRSVFCVFDDEVAANSNECNAFVPARCRPVLAIYGHDVRTVILNYHLPGHCPASACTSDQYPSDFWLNLGGVDLLVCVLCHLRIIHHQSAWFGCGAEM